MIDGGRSHGQMPSSRIAEEPAMSASAITRRTALGAGLVLVGLGAAAPATAFRERPIGEAETMIGTGCGASVEHREVVAELERSLGIRLTDEEGRKIAAALSCPRCGCPVTAMLADFPADPRF